MIRFTNQKGVTQTTDAMGVASRPILILIVGLAMMSDLTHRQISNRLIGFGIIFCLMRALGSLQILALLQVIEDLSVPVIVLYLFYRCRAIGAGDIKLLSVISGFIGLASATKVVLLAIVIGGAWSFVLLIARGALVKNMAFALQYVFSLMQGDLQAYPVESPGRENLLIPFSFCIGGALYLLLLLEML